MFSIAACNATIKDLFCKLLNFFLIPYPIFIINILALFILVKTFMCIFSLLNYANCFVAWRCNTIKLINASVIKHVLDVLDLDVAVKGHVRHHYSNIFRCDISISVKVIHIKRKLHLLIQVTNKYYREVSYE